MAFIFSDSFDFYTPVVSNPTDLPQGGWSSVDTPSRIGIVASVTRFGVGKSIFFRDNFTSIGKNFDANTSATIFVNVSHYSTTVDVGNTGSNTNITFGDSATAQFTISFARNGSIRLYRGTNAGTLLATYLNAFVINEWNNFQFKIKIDPVAGTFAVRKNGSSTDSFSATGLITRQTSNSYANYMLVSCNYNGDYFDDLYVFDDSGSAPNNWTGDLRSYSLTAVADTAQKDFTPQGAVDNYANVGKFSTNNATYNYSSTVGQEDLFDITDLSVVPSFISSVVVKTVMEKSDSDPREGQPVILSNVTTSLGTSVLLSTSWVGYLSNWSLDPDTSAAWNAAGVNNLQVGYKVSA